MKNNKKHIPVFYLIAKNGGTFIRDCNASIKGVVPILLTENQEMLIEIYIKNDKKYNNIKQQFECVDGFRKKIALGDFLEFKEVTIVSACILPAGIKKDCKLIGLIKTITNRKIKKYLGLREPLDRECSKYNYLKSFSSKHEKYHNSIKSKSIKEYISSEEMENDRFLKDLLNLKETDKISREEREKACNILSFFCVFDVKDTTRVIKKALKHLCDINKYTFSDLNKNESYGEKINKNSLTEKQLSDFLHKKKNEYFLYEKLAKKRTRKKNVFEKPVKNVSLSNCSFSHTMSFPDGSHISGDWDMRDCIQEYLGNLNFNNKRVLDVGAASGYLSFYMESEGAEVVSLDIPNGRYINIREYPEYKKTPKHQTNGMHNSYWYAHEKFQSKNNLYLSGLYKKLPEEIGSFDIAVFGMVISHLRDPMLALMNVLSLVKDRVVIINPFYKSQRAEALFSQDHKSLWWYLSDKCMEVMLKGLGFKLENVKKVYPKNLQKEQEYTVMVFQRFS